jgi:hypothetical protein
MILEEIEGDHLLFAYDLYIIQKVCKKTSSFLFKNISKTFPAICFLRSLLCSFLAAFKSL